MAFKWVYKWRGPLAALPVIFSFFCFIGEDERAIVAWPLGGLLFAAGWVLRMWAQKHLGYRLPIKRTVTTSGPYSLVRNPIYIANTLIILGTVAMCEVLWMVPLTLLWCALLYAVVVHYEESHLRLKYGTSYVDYLRAIPRWLPRRAGPSGTAHFHSSPGQIVLAEIYVVFIIAAPLAKEFIVARLFE